MKSKEATLWYVTFKDGHGKGKRFAVKKAIPLVCGDLDDTTRCAFFTLTAQGDHITNYSAAD